MLAELPLNIVIHSSTTLPTNYLFGACKFFIPTNSFFLSTSVINNSSIQFAAVAAIFLLLLVAVTLLIFNRIKTQAQIKSLRKVNEELICTNSHLESILASRSAEIREISKKAIEGERLKSAFISNMSHEVRTPLNGIMGFSRLLYDDSLSPKVRKSYLDIIERRSQSLLRLLNDILNISAFEAGKLEIKPTACNVNLLLNDLYSYFTSDSFEFRHPHVQVKVTQALPDSRAITITDGNRLEQVLTNLVENAFKYTPNGSVEFGYKLNEQTLLFFVSDTGIGIHQKDSKKVFERFSKISTPLDKTISSGAGLGLYIAKMLVELLNGEIWFESQPDKGSTFFFSIPYIPQKVSSIKHISRSMVATNILNLNEKVILVVEDDLISFQLIENLLEPTGAKIIHVKNGEDALEIALITPHIDLVLMDMQLPFLSGYEVTPLIKKERPSLPIVAQTAHAMEDDRRKCLSVGCDDYIPKPIDPDDFMLIIGKHLLNETTVSS